MVGPELKFSVPGTSYKCIFTKQFLISNYELEQPGSKLIYMSIHPSSVSSILRIIVACTLVHLIIFTLLSKEKKKARKHTYQTSET